MAVSTVTAAHGPVGPHGHPAERRRPDRVDGAVPVISESSWHPWGRHGGGHLWRRGSWQGRGATGADWFCSHPKGDPGAACGCIRRCTCTRSTLPSESRSVIRTACRPYRGCCQPQLCPITPLTPADTQLSIPQGPGSGGASAVRTPWACFLPDGVLPRFHALLLWAVGPAAMGTHLMPIPLLSGL